MASMDVKSLEDFLTKVDELESVVQGLKSDKDEDLQQAMRRADDMISKMKNKIENKEFDDDDDDEEVDDDKDNENLPRTKTGFSKTVINTTPSCVPEQPSDPFDGMSQEAFMAAMEQDAKERADSRKIREKEANEIKEKGNDEYRKGNFQQALALYSEAILKVRDNTVLYTNRAQTYLKLQRYDEALIDCDWALRVSSKCLKAHIHMGKAFLGLQAYEKARESYKKASSIDKKKENLIKDYLAEVDRIEEAEKQEKKAKQLFDSGDTGAKNMVELIEKVKKTDQLPIFYSGGFRIITAVLTNVDDRTLFRTVGGITLISNHPVFSRSLKKTGKSLSEEEIDMLASGVEMITAACSCNETNQELVLKIEGLPSSVLCLLDSKLKKGEQLLKISLIKFLHTCSQTDLGRSTIIALFDVPRLMTVLLSIMKVSSILTFAASLLNNLASEKKCKLLLRDKLEDSLLPSYEKFIMCSASPVSSLPACISFLLNLSSDKVIRSQLSCRRKQWEVCLHILETHRSQLSKETSEEIVSSNLGLLMNISADVSQYLREFGVDICKHCLYLLQCDSRHKLVISRCLGVLSHLLPHSIPAVDWLCDNSGSECLLNFIKSETEECTRSALKCLTACTQINDPCRQFIVDNKGLGTLMKLLSSSDEIVIGNAALCLSHCTQVSKVSAALAKTDIIKELLVLSRDGKKSGAQQNCAILVAKLCQGDSRHLERLRELHGVEILHTCMKHMK